jgi:hypothetical protein
MVSNSGTSWIALPSCEALTGAKVVQLSSKTTDRKMAVICLSFILVTS